MQYNVSMRLYLSSYSLGSQLDRLHAMVGENKRMLFIDNAKDYLPEGERAEHVRQKLVDYTEAGFTVEELDLRDYFGKPDELEARVSGAGLIWGSGGNTFILRRAMSYSGLDKILKAGLKGDSFVYGGSSAGSIVMTKTLRGTELGDNPYEVPAGYQENIVWTGLGMIYPQLVPHYQSEWSGDEAQAMADYFEHNGYAYETLRDGEVYIVDGDTEEKV